MTKKISSVALKSTALLALFAFAPSLAQAHPGHVHANSFSAGMAHPLSGWDHILAMVAVGLWAAQLGGRARWAVPAAFVSLMTIGGALGMAHLPLPMVETGILLSVLVLGLLLATAVRLPLWASMSIVGVFAVFHGHAHGTEIPVAISGFLYAVGFVTATALLHACGVGLGMLAQKSLNVPALRIAGVAIVLSGLCLCTGCTTAKNAALDPSVYKAAPQSKIDISLSGKPNTEFKGFVVVNGQKTDVAGNLPAKMHFTASDFQCSFRPAGNKAYMSMDIAGIGSVSSDQGVHADILHLPGRQHEILCGL